MKRAMDLLITVPAFLLLSPIMAAVGLAIRASMGPGVLFRQVRPGLRGAPFEMVKFRTMVPETDGCNGVDSDCLRLTPLGSLLRKTSLDELPELWNVLRGEMSLVGPRPLLMQYLERYDARQMRRHEVRPGITGWAQVNGRNSLSWEERFELDVWYVDHRSLRLDLRILWLTVRAVLRREGISGEGQATCEEFMGNSDETRYGEEK